MVDPSVSRPTTSFPSAYREKAGEDGLLTIRRNTPLFPETSYGVAKAIAELYVYDYARKGEFLLALTRQHKD
jgi:nucleoside-diphosphate-sugar epimerase